jgi:hypothetical protein
MMIGAETNSQIQGMIDSAVVPNTNDGIEKPKNGGIQPLLNEVTQRTVTIEERIAYPYLQAIAPMSNDEWPPRKDFFAAQFRDLSQNGFSFILDKAPEFSTLAVELGWQPCCHCFVCQVVNCTSEVMDGRTTYRVGCKFIRRMNRT